MSGSDTLTVAYTVINGSRDSLRWVRIGAGDNSNTMLVPAQVPMIERSPAGWRGVVVYPEETAHVHLWWEATNAPARLPPGHSATGLAVRVAGPRAVRPGLVGVDGRPVRSIDFTSLPFTVGGSGGSCWWGTVTRASRPPTR